VSAPLESRRERLEKLIARHNEICEERDVLLATADRLGGEIAGIRKQIAVVDAEPL
jgi:hypothetical protein